MKNNTNKRLSMIYRITPLILLFLMSFAPKAANTTKVETDPKLVAVNNAVNMSAKIELVYNTLNANNFSLPQLACFQKALQGFYSLKEKDLLKRIS